MADIKQVGGDHYTKVPGEQHWDRVSRLGLNYFQGSATAYVERALDKGHAVEDFEKAASYCLKAAALVREGLMLPRNENDPDYPKPPVVRRGRRAT